MPTAAAAAQSFAWWRSCRRDASPQGLLLCGQWANALYAVKGWSLGRRHTASSDSPGSSCASLCNDSTAVVRLYICKASQLAPAFVPEQAMHDRAGPAHPGTWMAGGLA